MARKVTSDTRFGRMRRAIDEGHQVTFIKELMHLALEASKVEDFKMSPQAFIELFNAFKHIESQPHHKVETINDIDDAE